MFNSILITVWVCNLEWASDEPSIRLLLTTFTKAPEDDFGIAGLTEDEEFSESNEEVYDTMEAGEAIIGLRRWGTQDDAWVEPEEGESIIWQFQSTGLCEPVSIRVARAGSYIIMHMNPLTARVDEEEAVILQ